MTTTTTTEQAEPVIDDDDTVYDEKFFSETIDRKGTYSYKYDLIRDKLLTKEEREKIKDDHSLIPLWIADMDFRTPTPITHAIQKRSASLVFGYTGLAEDYYTAIIGWFQRRHQRTIQRDWIIFSPGVVPAINYAIQAWTLPGDRVIVQPPVYYPFFKAIQVNGRQLVNNQLLYDRENGKYTMNIKQLEEQAKAGARLLILCSPHNPVCRLWTREELQAVADIVNRYDMYVVSDEIHCDILIGEKAKHVSFLEVCPDRVAVCTSISKTFNLPGLQVANIFIPNPRLRDLFRQTMEKTGFWGPNVFTPIGLIACYTKPGSWRWFAGVMDYIKGNLKFTCEYLGKYLPKVKIIMPEATTLLWLDFQDLATSKEDLRERMLTQASVALDDGYLFGDGGDRFTRINLASPRSILELALFMIVYAFVEPVPPPPGVAAAPTLVAPGAEEAPPTPGPIVETRKEVHINESQKAETPCQCGFATTK